MKYTLEKAKELYGYDYHNKHKFGDRPGGFAQGHWENWSRWDSIACDIKNLFNPNRVLELGCGCGSLTHSMRKRGIDAYGIDISEWAINNPVVPEIEPYISCLPAQLLNPDNKYDLIIAFDIIEHIPAEQYPELFSTLTKMSPKILMTVPLIETEVKKISEDELVEHYIRMNKEEWIEEITQYGYRPLSFGQNNKIASSFPLNKKNPDNYPLLFEVHGDT